MLKPLALCLAVVVSTAPLTGAVNLLEKMQTAALLHAEADARAIFGSAAITSRITAMR